MLEGDPGQPCIEQFYSGPHPYHRRLALSVGAIRLGPCFDSSVCFGSIVLHSAYSFYVAAATLHSTGRNSTPGRNSNPTDDSSSIALQPRRRSRRHPINSLTLMQLATEVVTRRLLRPRHITFYTRSLPAVSPSPTRPTDDLSIQSHLICFQLHHPATTLTRIDSDPSDSPTARNYNRSCDSRLPLSQQLLYTNSQHAYSHYSYSAS
eukprot:jgi/Psemu1/54583/gm1.54583_g